MKKIRRTIRVIGLMAIFLALMFSLAFAIEPIKPVAPKELQTPILKPRTDLKVDVIHASTCKCDLSDVDALYMGNIMVDVYNNYMQSGGAPTTAILTVTYHDLLAGRLAL